MFKSKIYLILDLLEFIGVRINMTELVARSNKRLEMGGLSSQLWWLEQHGYVSKWIADDDNSMEISYWTITPAGVTWLNEFRKNPPHWFFNWEIAWIAAKWTVVGWIAVNVVKCSIG